ncbi:hypothetical protein B0H10DRAFT_2214745 [Mycena sp. CBHHK59/15]|nr:hypothetical protein B0H10DRAFT_2214745 [Mycena sp. CBHHK59/15]
MSDDEVELFLRRTAIDDDGHCFYDQYTDAFNAMGNANLAAHEFGKTFERTTDKKGRLTYVTKPGDLASCLPSQKSPKSGMWSLYSLHTHIPF